MDQPSMDVVVARLQEMRPTGNPALPGASEAASSCLLRPSPLQRDREGDIASAWKEKHARQENIPAREGMGTGNNWKKTQSHGIRKITGCHESSPSQKYRLHGLGRARRHG
jgi:hypothetical protein